MCQKRNSTYARTIESGTVKKVDDCMRNIIDSLNFFGIRTVACCCGHDKYPMTIVVRWYDGYGFELFSGKKIERTKRFYKKDKEGFYYIPETTTKKAI